MVGNSVQLYDFTIIWSLSVCFIAFSSSIYLTADVGRTLGIYLSLIAKVLGKQNTSKLTLIFFQNNQFRERIHRTVHGISASC